MLFDPPMQDASRRAGAAPALRRRQRARGLAWAAALAFLLAWGGTAYWHTHKPLPAGVHVAGAWQEVQTTDVALIADITTGDAWGRPIVSHAIFDEVLQLVRTGQDFLVLDFFLFNSQRGLLEPGTLPLRSLSAELRAALIERKRADPGLPILFITDAINEVYGAEPSADLELLRAAGIEVVVTALDPLRDSNYLYSSLWRLLVRWWAPDGAAGRTLPHPFEPEPARTSLHTWARLANFKANHRKLILTADSAGVLQGLITSANPHDASSAHSNVAVRLKGPALVPLLASELAIAGFSGWRAGPQWQAVASAAAAADATQPATAAAVAGQAQTLRARVLTEGAIRSELLERIGATRRGDSIDIAMFYLSEREVIAALLGASRRGVNVRLILDPNRDAFGRTKNGVPNRPVASELAAASDGDIRIRWYRTRGEQFHTKVALIHDAERLWITAGSANFTRRNLADYNLEANVAMEVPRGSELALQALEYFDTLWHNRAPLGIEYTADFGVFADPAQSRYWQYRIMEATGLSTF